MQATHPNHDRHEDHHHTKYIEYFDHSRCHGPKETFTISVLLHTRPSDAFALDDREEHTCLLLRLVWRFDASTLEYLVHVPNDVLFLKDLTTALSSTSLSSEDDLELRAQY